MVVFSPCLVWLCGGKGTQGRVGLDRVGNGQGRAGLRWAGLGLGRVGLGWVGLGWAGLARLVCKGKSS